MERVLGQAGSRKQLVGVGKEVQVPLGRLDVAL